MQFASKLVALQGLQSYEEISGNFRHALHINRRVSRLLVATPGKRKSGAVLGRRVRTLRHRSRAFDVGGEVRGNCTCDSGCGGVDARVGDLVDALENPQRM